MDFLVGQIHTFLIMLGLGFLLGVLFHLYQIFLKKSRIGRKWLAFMDILFGIVTGIIGFSILVFANYGELRFFILISILTGLLLYFYVARIILKKG